MNAKVLLAVMIGASALAVGKAATTKHGGSAPEPVAARRATEKPWLANDAAAQIVSENGKLGPLFAGVELGMPVPPRERALIAEFARKHDVTIDLDVKAGVLAAIKFDVSYGGCCGYEAADSLARRIGRPSEGGGCFGDKVLLNDWASSPGDGSRMRAKVDVNKVSLRWESELSVPELLARADGLVGRPADAVGKHAGERWISGARGSYLLEEPYPFERPSDWAPATRWQQLGFGVDVANNRVSTVSFTVRNSDAEPALPQLVAHWGKPRKTAESWSWTKVDRTITADVSAGDVVAIVVRDR